MAHCQTVQEARWCMPFEASTGTVCPSSPSLSPWHLLFWVIQVSFLGIPGSPVVRTWHFQCRGPGSIPGQGTKIPQTTWYSPLSSQKRDLMMEVAQHQIYWYSGKKGPSIVWWLVISSAIYHLQFSSVTQSCPILCDPMDCSMPGLPVHHQLLEFTQTHVHWVGDAIQPSHPLLSPSPLTFNLS